MTTQDAIGTISVDSEDRLVWRVPRECSEFILLPQLTRGFGSSWMNIDRGQPGSLRHVRWVRRGRRLLLEQMNTHYLATKETDTSVGDSFAASIIVGAPILEENDEWIAADVTSLAGMDLVGVLEWARMAGQAAARLDPTLGAIRADETYAHAAGIEITADLVFVGFEGERGTEVLPDGHSGRVTQRLTALPLPNPELPPRRFDVRSGGYGKRFQDVSLPQDGILESGWQPRFRLSDDHPIVFSVDPDIPEPWRTAIVAGGNWWARGFAAAGAPRGFRVEVRDRDLDPARAGVNPVWWVHRSGRGWSMGAALTDPRTGEILKGNVRLGAQRLQQLTQLGEALLSPYGRADEDERRTQIREMVLARVRQLAAHEIGHALGFMHNYASTSHASTSVMDYPHPRLRVTPDGGIDLGGAYATDIGPWDVASVIRAYGDEDDARAARRESADLPYLTDDDGHGEDAAAPLAVPWTVPGDPVDGLIELLEVRDRALTDFGPGAAPPGAQVGELSQRYVLVHLLHRYQVVAAARLLGGVHYEYGRVDDAVATHDVPPREQQRALLALARCLDAASLMVPARIARLLAPPSIRHTRSGADFDTARGPVFDPLEAAAAAAQAVAAPVLRATRLNRLHAQRSTAGTPSISDVLLALVDGTRAEGSNPEQADAAVEARRVIILEAIRTARSGRLRASAASALRSALSATIGTLDELEGAELRPLAANERERIPPAPRLPDGIPI